MKHSRAQLGSAAVWLSGTLGLLIGYQADAAVFDYSATFKNVLLTLERSTVHYRVFDTARTNFVNGEDGSGNISNLNQTDGVVYWTDGSRVFCRIYDQFRGRWMKADVVSGGVTQLTSKDGVMAWVSSGFVYHAVYDATRGAWVDTRIAFSGSPTGLQTRQGLVAWMNQTAAFYSAYDPILGRWVNQTTSAGAAPSQMSLEDGVVAWSNGTTVFCRTYDPVAGKWMGRDITTGGVGNLKNKGGVVAWSATSVIHFAVYDPTPARQSWQIGEADTGLTTNLTVSHGTVTWTSGQAGEDDFIRGYDATEGQWLSRAARPAAMFATSNLSGTAPLVVYFIDMSLGASGWCWNFSATDVSARRSPVRRLEGGVRNVALAVTGPDERTHVSSRFIVVGGGGGGGEASMESASFSATESIRAVDGIFQATITGTPGDILLIERSTDLMEWNAVTTLTNVDGSVEFIDTTVDAGRRFYRVRALRP